MPPKVIARNADRQGGVLPVSAAARASPGKAVAPRLKLEVRRLPPGLTLTEFEETLGDEWKLNNGKVDWREYRQGKTRLPGSGKVPEQSRCYLHVSNETYVREFERRFLEVAFPDKAGTHKNPDLKHLAPTLGYAPNQRTPLQQQKQRTDNRQGTIDQDAEFIAFLEAETQPIVKATAVDIAHQEQKSEKVVVRTTPLIEDLREKKAIKAKAAHAKADKTEKDKKAVKSNDAKPATDKDSTAIQQQKVEQAAKELGKVATKQAAAKQAQQTKVAPTAPSKKPAPTSKPQRVASNASTTGSAPTSPAAQRVSAGPRQRANADGIKKMLQKDLGIRPKPTPPTQPAASPAATTTSPPPKTSTPATTAPPPKVPAPKPSPTSPKAYLKHANPSQGMTEILIQQALAQYGEMGHVTIDPRKGTAIAVFKDGEGLRKALEAKRVVVAKGAVEVLEFRERGNVNAGVGRGGFRGGRGGRGGGRGGAQSNAGGAAAATSAPAA